jgi:hypothetical protein
MANKSYPVKKDGVSFEVRASSAEEARAKAEKTDISTVPRVIARQGSTRVFERPNGQRYVVSPGASFTDPAKVEKVLSGMTAGEVSREGIDEDLIQQYPVAARAGELARGIPLVGSRTDELVGAIAGPEAAAGMRAVSGAMQRQRPGQTLGLNLAGGLLAGGGAAAAAPKKAVGLATNVLGSGSRASQFLRGAATGSALGALEGGIYGSGEGTNGPERASQAIGGAKAGAAVGAVTGGAAPLVSEAAGNIISLFKRDDINKIAREFGISKMAAKVIKNTFDQGGDIDAAVTNLGRAGDEAMLADAGPAAQALLDAANVFGGAAGRTVRTAIGQRMARTGEAVEQSLNEALGQPPEGPRTAVMEIAERTRPQRDQAYSAAYAQPIDYASKQGRAIETVLSRINRINPKVLQSAIAEANADMEYRNLTNQQIMAQIADDGTVRFSNPPNVQQLDEIKKALGKIAYQQNVDQFGRLTNAGVRYAGLAGELKDAISGAVGPYKSAVAIGGDKLAEERAFKLGAELLSPKTRVEDLTFDLGSNPSQSQIEAAKSGVRMFVNDALTNVRAIASEPAADALEARKVGKAVTDLSSDNARAKIRQLMGIEADALLDQIDQAAQSAFVRAAMAQNAKTAGRLAIDQTVGEITAPGVVGQAMQGEAINTTKAMIQAVTGQTAEYTAARRQQIYNDIAKALTEKGGENALAALKVMDAAMRGQSLTGEQTDQLAKMISGVLFSGATPSATRSVSSEYRPN